MTYLDAECMPAAETDIVPTHTGQLSLEGWPEQPRLIVPYELFMQHLKPNYPSNVLGAAWYRLVDLHNIAQHYVFFPSSFELPSVVSHLPEHLFATNPPLDQEHRYWNRQEVDDLNIESLAFLVGVIRYAIPPHMGKVKTSKKIKSIADKGAHSGNVEVWETAVMVYAPELLIAESQHIA